MGLKSRSPPSRRAVSYTHLDVYKRQGHEPANITGATIEIPGDDVLIKDKNTIIFSVCNVYYEARRRPVSSGNRK